MRSFSKATILLLILERSGGRYSSVPNKRTGWNFDKNSISVQGGILIKILEKLAILLIISKTFESILIFSQNFSRLGLNI